MAVLYEVPAAPETPPGKPAASAMPVSLDEARFLASEDAACMQAFARCGECLARSAEEMACDRLTEDEAASLQWVRCAQCRCGAADLYRR